MPTDLQVEAAARAYCNYRGVHPDTLLQATPGDPEYSWPRDKQFIDSKGITQPLIKSWRRHQAMARAMLEAAENVEKES